MSLSLLFFLPVLGMLSHGLLSCQVVDILFIFCFCLSSSLLWWFVMAGLALLLFHFQFLLSSLSLTVIGMCHLH